MTTSGKPSVLLL